MTDRSIARRRRQWEQRGAALPYRWHERLGDWWCATRDAGADVPAMPRTADPTADAGARTALGTPHMVMLSQLGCGWAEREWIAFHAETMDVHADLERARERRNDVAEQLKVAQATLDGTPEELADPDRAAAAPGEEDADPEVLRYRRRAEYRAHRRAVLDEVSRLQSVLTESRTDVARLAEQIRVRREIAHVRVAMIEAYVRRRCAAYLVRLARKHPDGKRITADVAASWPVLPSWLRIGPPAAAAEAS